MAHPAAQAGAVVTESNFEEVVRERQSMVFSIAYHFLQDRWAAEELAQEVFLQLYRNLGRMESDEHLKFWLRRVTTHRCIDAGRRRVRQPQVSLEMLPEPAQAAAGDRDPLLERALAKLVASLPERQRAIVVLRYQEDLDPSEIAQLLDVPLGTVKSQLHRALAMLREKLRRSHGDLEL